jgi:hypothetical protein
MFHRRTRAYPTIAQAADRYCWKFWGHHVTDVVYDRCDEPDDGCENSKRRNTTF